MAKVVRLRHRFLRTNSVIPFYEGVLHSEQGVVTIPFDKVRWIRKAWKMGYRFHPETGRRFDTWNQLMASAVEESAESASTDSGRQSADSDGLRQSEPDSGERSGEERTRSSSRNRPAVSDRGSRAKPD